MDFQNQILGALIGLIIGTLLGNEISRILNKPKVKVRFKNISPLTTKNGKFWSILIVNFGRTVATNCNCFITLFDISKEDIINENLADKDEDLPSYSYEKIDIQFPREQFVSQEKFREIKNESLCWSKHGNPDAIDINPGVVESLDVCKCQSSTDQKSWYLIFPSEEGWRKVRIRLKLKAVSGRIFICPSNEFPTLVDFKIEVNENGEPVFHPIRYGLFKRFISFCNRRKLFA